MIIVCWKLTENLKPGRGHSRQGLAPFSLGASKEMCSIWDYENRVVAQHNLEKPFAPENGEPLKFSVGDIVAFTNEYGVMFRGLRVTGFYKPEKPCSLYATGMRYLLDWSSPWFPAKESSLQLDSEVVAIAS